jgi:DNA polymerase III delta prime subunit
MSYQVVELVQHLDKEAKQPTCIKKQLKPHQLMSIQKCLDIENGISSKFTNSRVLGLYRPDVRKAKVTINTNFGAICDPVGSGKTLVVLSLIKEDMNVTKSFSNSIEISDMVNLKIEVESDHTDEILKKIKYSLIVVPHVILTQWDKVIKNDTTLKHVVFKNLDQLKQELNTNPDIDIILVKNTKYREFYDLFGINHYFKRIFYDEADSIRISKCEKIDSLFYWFVTASCDSLVYGAISSTGFLRTVFCKANHDILKHLIVKNNEKFIHESFNLEDYKSIITHCTKNNILSILSSHISDNVQRMICAGDIEGAMSTFDLQSTSEDNIIKIVCEDLCIKLENKKNKLEYIYSKHFVTEKAKKESIAKIEYKINKLEQSLEDISNKIKESDLDPITYLDIENPVITKCCKTKFDFESITIYILSKQNPLCPICRTLISKDKLIRISEEKEEEKEEEREEEWCFADHTKLDNIVKIIEDLDDNAKIIIFSEFDKSNHVISHHKDFKWKVKEIKGSATHIDNVVKWFQDSTGEKKILFMNSRYAGAGLNLEAGTDVFIYHRMNSDLTHQIIGRCQRPNRTGVLKVYNFDEE